MRLTKSFIFFTGVSQISYKMSFQFEHMNQLLQHDVSVTAALQTGTGHVWRLGMQV